MVADAALHDVHRVVVQRLAEQSTLPGVSVLEKVNACAVIWCMIVVGIVIMISEDQRKIAQEDKNIPHTVPSGSFPMFCTPQEPGQPELGRMSVLHGGDGHVVHDGLSSDTACYALSQQTCRH
eukprot:GDKK01048199.1.p1 GENE.GDKK01048199.1~~GDKK01048199.1.p1  ORF type:complete len:130 (-),score=2.37 GDKK01048199.1:175-543(-)